MNPIKAIPAVLLSLSLSAASTAVYAEKTQFSPYVDSQGNISLPEDFRAEMSHLGSWFVPEGGASGFHDVYANKAGVQSYRKNHKFADGTIIIKELRSNTSGDYTTGAGVHYANSNIKQWFVMVKDAQGRYSNNPNWGNGWGWALFKTDDPTVNVSTDYKADCLGCHTPVKDKDWVYTEGYPTLK
ncbi:cytochrome P460 family protein [Litoribacillus peritrichatus]|uniref:Cytochrome P460 domain-containing protein n=1 Tax=Litoribacillus peritrichatus TaxID=718191 RepID=A0ABP7ME64_9GAMM